MRRIFWILITIFALAGCTTTKYIPVEKVVYSTDTLYRNRTKIDSVYFEKTDSFYIKGDTIHDIKWRTKYILHSNTDTLYLHKTDSVRVPVAYEVEKKLNKWQQFKMEVGGYSIFLLFAIVTGLLLYITKKVFKLW